jgi:hypothetical protein
MTARFVARRTEIEKRALDLRARPTGLSIARLVGLSPRTVASLFAGEAASAASMARVVSVLGGGVDDWFELVVTDDAE